MTRKLLIQPYYVMLLPVFFILHYYTEHWQFIEAGEAALQLLKHILISIVTWSLLLIIYKNKHKAGILTLILLAINFFFPIIHDFIKQHSPVSFFGRYIFLLPLLFLLVIFAGARLYKSTRSIFKPTLYLNLLFLILIITDTSLLAYRVINPNSYNRIHAVTPPQPVPCDTCSKPDIYFLLFDGYSSSLSLKEQFNYDNSELDSFLISNGYKIQYQSQSNYNWTPFSMASIFNMSYLTVPDPDALVFADYVHASQLITNNILADFLKKEGYQIENYSIFDFGGEKTILPNDFMHSTTPLLTEKTFINKLRVDIGWHFSNGKGEWSALSKLYDKKFNSIQKRIELIKKSSLRKPGKPRFIYGHLLMPHSPFFMDKMERVTDIQKLVNSVNENSANAYLNYLYYTNTVIQDISKTIQKNTGGKAVIIIMGDHGIRTSTDPYPEHFQNLNAVYYPDGDYEMLYDNITGVNQFRVILNKLFHQSLPLIKDSTYYLRDKK